MPRNNSDDAASALDILRELIRSGRYSSPNYPISELVEEMNKIKEAMHQLYE